MNKNIINVNVNFNNKKKVLKAPFESYPDLCLSIKKAFAKEKLP